MGGVANTSNKSEASKCIYTIQSLQNERTAESEIFVTKRRLYVQARSKGCMLLCSFTEKIEEIHSVPLVRKLIRIFVPMFWLGSYPTNFHKIIENSNCNFASHKYKNDYLLERHASNGSLYRKGKHVPRHSNLLVTTSGFCNQLEKVCFDTSAGDGIFVAKNQLTQPRNISHRRENTESKNKMSKFTDRTSTIDCRINNSDWFVDINNPSSIASKITMLVSSAAANITLKGKPFISAKNSSEPPIKNRITMVDKKSRSLQWSIISSTSCTGSHTDRCLNKGLGQPAMVYQQTEYGQPRKRNTTLIF